MFFKIVCLLLIVLVAVIAQSPFLPCENFKPNLLFLPKWYRILIEFNSPSYSGSASEPRPTTVQFPNCSAVVCTVRRNTTAELRLGFNTTRLVACARSDVLAFINGRWLIWPLGTQTNVCANLISGRCPLAAGANATYRANLVAPSLVPANTRFIIQARIVNQLNQVVSCTRINVLIQWHWPIGFLNKKKHFESQLFAQ